MSNPKNNTKYTISNELLSKIRHRPLDTIIRQENNDANKIFIQLMKNRYINLEIPNEFNGKEVWKKFLSPVINQGSCGSCWAFASTSTLSDRFNIQSKGQMNIILSATKILLCNSSGRESRINHPEIDTSKELESQIASLSDSACFGNTLIDAFRYLFLYGTTTEDCVPYNEKLGYERIYQKIGSFSDKINLPTCQAVTGIFGDFCSDYFYDSSDNIEGGTGSRFYRAYSFYTLDDNEDNIKREIYKWGPVASGMKIYPNFYEFDPKREIYDWNNIGEQIGGHAIEIVGWGEDNNVKFWWVKNSWGKEWGIDGYFRIIRGKNVCEIETNIIAPVPDFFYPKEYELSPEISMDKILVKQREDIENKFNIKFGGIDRRSGYSRRIMMIQPWLDFSPPIELSKLPNWNNFIAGNINIHHSNRIFIFLIILCSCTFFYFLYKTIKK